ncbi:MAG: tetratricopeptide repeat protein, partial [Acidobacteriota bacterium]
AAGLDKASLKGSLAEKKNRLAAVTSALGMDENPELEKYFRGGEPQAEEAALAMTEYLEGRGLKAFLLAQSASGYSPNEAFYSGFLRTMARLTGNEVRKDEVLPRALMIKEKTRKAASAFYVQNFEYSVRQCEEILLLDPGNALVWTRLGSSYFMMGDRGKSRAAYEKARELDPGDKMTAEFMKAQGW